MNDWLINYLKAETILVLRRENSFKITYKKEIDSSGGAYRKQGA